MSSEKVTAGIEHFEATMGSLPAPMVTFVREAPEAFEGYMGMRTWLMRDPPEGALDRKIKHLIFCLLDVALGNLEGATNHARAAVRSGLTIEELTAGIVQVYMTCGVATWGRTGYKVLDAIREDAEA
jgi:alkylhydroperoxidase/carboxymuconolactone decarboxylase family protein YurZ